MRHEPTPIQTEPTPSQFEGAARLLAEIAVQKNPRRSGFSSFASYTVAAVDRIVERTWRSYLPEAAALSGFFDAQRNRPSASQAAE